MSFLHSLSLTELQQFSREVTRSADIKTHMDLLTWLQGDMQHYLPHAILIAAWGNFSSGAFHHDIVSPLPGVRSNGSKSTTLRSFLLEFHSRWLATECRPFAVDCAQTDFHLGDADPDCSLAEALKQMRSVIVHGINDERSQHDCIYLTFSPLECFTEIECAAMAVSLPYIDAALRQIALLPHQSDKPQVSVILQAIALGAEEALTEREDQILHCVALGKTNLEIGNILNISAFTVKNHLQRIFKKLNVSNRAQAVSKVTAPDVTA